MGILTVGDERDLKRNPPAVRQELPLTARSATKILKGSRSAATSDLKSTFFRLKVLLSTEKQACFVYKVLPYKYL